MSFLATVGAECYSKLYSDTTSVHLKCVQFPEENSLPNFCSKTKWWKQSQMNPFDSIRDANVCKRRCNCRVYTHLDVFGAPTEAEA